MGAAIPQDVRSSQKLMYTGTLIEDLFALVEQAELSAHAPTKNAEPAAPRQLTKAVHFGIADGQKSERLYVEGARVSRAAIEGGQGL